MKPPAGRAGAEGEGKMTPNQRERQIMQRLRGNGWVKAFMLPDRSKTIEGLLAKGWIEGQGLGHERAYRLTDAGLAAKKVPMRVR